jgi:predicted DNA-binding transcriptional regulator AlpA
MHLRNITKTIKALYLTEKKTSDRIAVSKSALRKWRREGLGPPYVKLGRMIRYPLADLKKWLNNRIRSR